MIRKIPLFIARCYLGASMKNKDADEEKVGITVAAVFSVYPTWSKCPPRNPIKSRPQN